ncbi:MAG: hypothetical protein RQ741_08890 [Wenzhouxiangellaceae bacterium]|nr:hypothetical protein [Wenzhouxiangellaceae bacterium]
MNEQAMVGLASSVHGHKLFAPLFARAATIAEGQAFSEPEHRRFITETIDAFRSREARDGGRY